MSAYDPLESNLIELKPDTPLFRITKLDYVLSDILCGALTMPRVMSWDDTHEAAYFRTQLLTAEDEPVSIEELGLEWFGQSWSMQAESDAMWRIYNSKFDSIRLETTAGALLGTLHAARAKVEPQFADWSRLSLFLGRVSYHDKASYTAVMGQRFEDLAFGGSADGFAGMLLQKRDPFDHEREARILYQVLGPGDHRLDDAKLYVPDKMKEFKFRQFSKTVPELIRLPFEWQAVTSAMIGPRTPPTEAQSLETKLRAKAPWMSITHSELYGPPEFSGRL